MTCRYRVALVIDGGDDSLLVPVVGLNYLTRNLGSIDLNPSLYSWVDLVVASGTGSLFGTLLCMNDQNILGETKDWQHSLENGANRIYETLGKYYESEVTLSEFKKHFSFISYDVDLDESFVFSSTNPYQSNTKVGSMLKACTSDPISGKFMLYGNRHLTSASSLCPNPILFADHFANCMFIDEHVIFLSIGSGNIEDDKLNQIAEDAHHNFLSIIRNHRKWHYFRFNPTFTKDMTISDKIEATNHYFEHEAHNIERLLRLMEMRTGNLL